MDSDAKKSVVVPAYKVSSQIKDVISTMPEIIDCIIVVDDKCPEGSGKIVEALNDARVTVIYHDENKGVGGAVKSGYRKALSLGCDIVVKMDGDGQMNPKYLESLIKPLLHD